MLLIEMKIASGEKNLSDHEALDFMLRSAWIAQVFSHLDERYSRFLTRDRYAACFHS